MSLKRIFKIALAVLAIDIVFGSALLFAIQNDRYLGVPGSSAWTWINPLAAPIMWWGAFMAQVLIVVYLLLTDRQQ